MGIKRVSTVTAPKPPRSSPEPVQEEAAESYNRRVLKTPSVDPDHYMKLVVGKHRFEDIANPDIVRSGRTPSKPMTTPRARGEAMS